VAAKQLGRQWIGIDFSINAYELVNKRLTQEVANPNDQFKYQNEIHLRTDPPKRTDLATDYREKKFVYVISHPAYPGEYKVGIAKDWKLRLNAYQTSDPDRQYQIEFRMETPQFRETERHIHEVFPNKHEWVQGDLKAIVVEKELWRRTNMTQNSTINVKEFEKTERRLVTRKQFDNFAWGVMAHSTRRNRRVRNRSRPILNSVRNSSWCDGGH